MIGFSLWCSNGWTQFCVFVPAFGVAHSPQGVLQYPSRGSVSAGPGLDVVHPPQSQTRGSVSAGPGLDVDLWRGNPPTHLLLTSAQGFPSGLASILPARLLNWPSFVDVPRFSQTYSNDPKSSTPLPCRCGDQRVYGSFSGFFLGPVAAQGRLADLSWVIHKLRGPMHMENLASALLGDVYSST